jgi:hypothetical protein
MSDWPRYLAPMLREEGRLALETGDTTGATEAFRAYLEFRHAPDASFGDEVDSVRTLLDRIEPAALRTAPRSGF